MDLKHSMLLRNILEAGAIPLSNTGESRCLLDELVQVGLVEIVRPDGLLPDGHAPLPEYHLTPQGRAIAESHSRK